MSVVSGVGGVEAHASAVSPMSTCLQVNSRKRKPRSKKSKTLKPTKMDEMMKSPSSDGQSDKKSDDEDDMEEDDKVRVSVQLVTQVEQGTFGRL